MNSPIEPIALTRNDCDKFLTVAHNKGLKTFTKPKALNLGIQLTYVDTMKEIQSSTTFENFTIDAARIHHFDPNDFIEEHIDDAYDGDVYICRLDPSKDKRLTIKGKHIQEGQGHFTLVPKGYSS
tara:strand:+ start:63 stop:437 length:375 start_codon:yes stop_codon:yes gene_type:complete